jgi:3-oxoacyl-(acyl-carrier-protein) synthase
VRIGIASVGLATPLGLGVGATMDGWLAGRSGLADNDRWPTRWFVRADAGLVPGFQPRKQLPDRKAVKLMSREAQLGLFAAMEAAGPNGPRRFGVDPLRFGGFAAAGYEVSSLEDSEEMLALARDPEQPGRISLDRLFGPARDAYSPIAPLKILPNMALYHAAATLDLQGPHLSLGSSPAAGLAAAIEAGEALRFDEADAALVLGTDANVEVFRTHQLVEAGVLESLAPAEGAGAVVLREAGDGDPLILGHALGQDVPAGPDPREHYGVISDPRARARLHRAAMEAAGLSTVDLILADLWGEPERDGFVRQGLPDAPTASTRLRLGWLGGAAAVVDLALASELVRRGRARTVLVSAAGLAGDLAAVVVGAA